MLGRSLLRHLSARDASSVVPCPRSLGEHAREFRDEIGSLVLPFWYDTAVDRVHGGFVPAADRDRPLPAPSEKQLVSQARLVWLFSHAAVHGFDDPARDFRGAARQGVEFLARHFHDSARDGYLWKATASGVPLVDRKILYGQAFVIFALVEYFRATGDATALERALALHGAVEKHARDREHGGYIEHFDAGWKPLLSRSDTAPVEVPGLKSANTHMHWMEALSELYAVTGDATVRESLEEVLRVSLTWFYPLDPEEAALHRRRDGRLLDPPRYQKVSYGHNVEFAWLMLRAEETLGLLPSWDHFAMIVTHALRLGYDRDRGGLFAEGVGVHPAHRREKLWWPQAELIAALTVASQGEVSALTEKPLHQTIDFIRASQIDAATGMWLSTVDEDGRPRDTSLAGEWKSGYHELRAMVKFVEAFQAHS